MITTPVLAAPNGQVGEILDIATATGNAIRAQVMAADLTPLTSPVYVEAYLAANGNSIRAALRAALLDNMTAGWFILPAGDWQWTWPGAPAAGVPQLTLADGLRNNIKISGQQTRLYIDQQGVPSNQRIMLFRNETGATHADRIWIDGIRFDLLNVVTSFSGFAVGFEAASNCRITNCEAFCTLDASVVPPALGHIRWGFALFGGDWSIDATGGRNNLFQNIKLTFSQLQGCAQPRSCNGVIFENIQSDQSQDSALSCCSTTAAATVQNVLVKNVQCNDLSGAACMLLGNDGIAVGNASALIENIIVDGVELTGRRNPATTFDASAAVLIFGGTILRRVVVANVAVQLNPNDSVQCDGVIIQGHDAETLSESISVANIEAGPMTTNDPLYGLFIGGINTTRVAVANVHCKGRRGMKFLNVDALTLVNCETDDGACLIQAEARNMTRAVALSNCSFRSTTGFNRTLVFQSNSGKSFSRVFLSNLELNSNVDGLQTTLAGGTMRMFCCNIDNVAGSINVETIAGIVREVNCFGMSVNTVVPVNVPAVAAGNVDYVNVSMAGTRLADLNLAEGVQANPSADLAAGGAAGGGYIGCRVSAAGTVRLAFLGPIAAAAGTNFTFSRTAQ